MPRKKAPPHLDKKISKDLLSRPVTTEIVQPTTLWEALQLVEFLVGEINGYLSESPLVQDYALLYAKRANHTRGNFEISFDSRVLFNGVGSRKAAPAPQKITKATDKTEEAPNKKPKKAPPTELETLMQRASEMGIDVSDISKDEQALRDRISLMEEMEEKDDDVYEVGIIENTRPRRRQVRVRGMGASSNHKKKTNLAGLGGALSHLQDKTLEGVANYVTDKNGLKDD